LGAVDCVVDVPSCEVIAGACVEIVDVLIGRLVGGLVETLSAFDCVVDVPGRAVVARVKVVDVLIWRLVSGLVDVELPNAAVVGLLVVVCAGVANPLLAVEAFAIVVIGTAGEPVDDTFKGRFVGIM